jgi:hypothetical protein
MKTSSIPFVIPVPASLPASTNTSPAGQMGDIFVRAGPDRAIWLGSGAAICLHGLQPAAEVLRGRPAFLSAAAACTATARTSI